MKCPLCGSASRLWFHLDHGRIRQCLNDSCGLGFVEHQPDENTLAHYYEQLYYPAVRDRVAPFANSDIARMRQHFSALDHRLGLRGKRVLDYGCGIGNFLRVARDNGCSVCGLEYDDRARDEAQGLDVPVYKSAVELTDNSFDFVYMNDVIEHLRDPVAALRELRRKMKPGASLFIVTMNMSGLKGRLLGRRWDVVTNPTHLWWYRKSSLGRTLATAGYPRWEVQNFPVDFAHHGLLRRRLQRVLQATGLDASLRALCWSAVEDR